MARQLPINQPFDLALSLKMGQAFRWYELPPDFYGDGYDWFSGVLGENLVHISQVGGLNGQVRYRIGGPDGERAATAADNDMLRRYFRVDDEVSAIYAQFSSSDAHLAKLLGDYSGMRLLRQDPWECTVAYLCSANNNIPQITRTVERIAAEFGDPIQLGDEVRHVFPGPERLISGAAEERLHSMRLGLKRAPNIVAAARRVVAGGLDLYALRDQPYPVSKLEIGKLSGVGDKIADCIALFALDQTDAFPLDRHIGRALLAWPDCPFPHVARYLKPSDYLRTVAWAQERFGKYAGYAGQLMFCAQPK